VYTCANCTVLACANNEPEKMPKNCPMRNASVMETARAGYDLPENHDSAGLADDRHHLKPLRTEQVGHDAGFLPQTFASVMETARAGYDLPENHDFYINCSAIEGLG